MLTLMLHQSVNVAWDCAMHPRLFEGGPKHTYLTRWNMRDGDEAPEAYEWASRRRSSGCSFALDSRQVGCWYLPAVDAAIADLKELMTRRG